MKFIWHDSEINNIGSIMSAISKIYTEEEADEFMRQYRECSHHADSNIGYISGYFSPDECERVQRLFKVKHPILKYAPEDDDGTYAMRMGMRVASLGHMPNDAELLSLHRKILEGMSK